MPLVGDLKKVNERNRERERERERKREREREIVWVRQGYSSWM